MKEANKRLAKLTKRFNNHIMVIGFEEPWGSDEEDTQYAFYLEHGPSATGISWEEYFYLEREAGFHPSDLTYEQHREELGQW